MKLEITKQMIENLRIGDTVPTIFGERAKVTDIIFKGVSPVDGKAYIGFYHEWSKNAKINDSWREGETWHDIDEMKRRRK